MPVSRSPCGERGLKWGFGKNALRLSASLPVRGAWIEILKSASRCKRYPSLPVRGAWIEIFQIFRKGVITAVAPRAGSVD